MKYTHIIWDFNGTVFDDTEASLKSENALLTRYGMKPLENVEAYRKVFRFPIIEYYRALGYDFSKKSFEELSSEWITEYLNFSKQSKIHPHFFKSKDFFHNQGLKQILLSASEKNILTNQLSELGISDCFDEILGLSNPHAYSKKGIALEWFEKNPSAKALFIGDTTHDKEVADAVGADCVLIAGGHQSRDILEKENVPVFNSLEELINSL